jgi:hypothetical protein
MDASKSGMRTVWPRRALRRLWWSCGFAIGVIGESLRNESIAELDLEEK